ncbi:MAG: hypothetical protein RL113_1337 [Pseudomonadota bacterium]
MKEYRSLALTIIAIFIITFMAAYYSTSFEAQQNYLSLFILLGVMLFIFSVLVVFALLGFKSFAIFLALLLGLVLEAYGPLGAFFVTAITYFIWGSVFVMELLLFQNGSEGAKEWFLERYAFQTFKIEYYSFYPLMGFLYLILEVIPHLFSQETLVKFSPKEVFEKMKLLLK